MAPLDFIAAVVPSAGVLCVAELSSKRKEHVFVDSVAEFAPHIDRFNKQKRDVYFALASFVESGSRTAPNALYMKALFIDIDCGESKPYLTKQMAASALDTFLQDTALGALGNPWVVSSGGGLHVYWPFTENIAIAEWRRVAENFKRLCKKNALHIDFTVTADAARVLRVPDTFNWKIKDKPRRAKILVKGSAFKFEDIDAAIKEKINGEAITEPIFNPAAIPGIRPKRQTATQVKLVENSVTRFKTIMLRTESGSGCLQLKHYVDNAQQDGMEPLWRGLLSIAQKCVDGNKAASWLSSLHPYTPDRMEQKLKEIKGPYPCTKIDGENPGVCEKCSHWKKITNPLALGRELAVDNEEKEIVVQPEAVTPDVTTSQIKVTRPTPPRGFSYGKNGGIYREVEMEDESKNIIKKQILVLPYDLFVVDLLSVNGEHYVFMLAMRPEGAVKVSLQQKAVVSKDDTVKSLAAQNVVAAYGSGNDKNLFDYVRACVEVVSSNKHAIPVPTSYGWQPDGGFVAGGKIFMTDQSVRQIPMPGLENITHATTPKGTLEEWRKFPELLIAKELYDILAIGCGVGFGSPLMEFSGLDGMTFHAGSTESGTGKTVALEMAASIWGHPRDYRVGKSTSGVAMQQRAGLLRNLPLLSDEITSKSRRDAEWFPEFVFDLAEGRAKERMESGANKERLNTSVWGLLAILSSNTHMVDYMTGARKHSSEGELRRMLEWTPNMVLTWEAHEVEVIKILRHNHGIAGDVYAQWLALNRDVARTVYQSVYKRIRIEFKMTNDERFWHAGVACCVAGCILAGPKYANIVTLPVQQIINSLKAIVEKTRLTVRSNVRTAEDILNAYIREFYGRFVVVRAIDGAIQATFGASGTVDESITRTEICGRVERNVTPGFVNFFIEEQLLKAYCSSMSFGYVDFRKQMEAAYRVEYTKKDMLSKTKGPQMRVNAIKISRPESTLLEADGEENKNILPVE
jgi:hypothetical protein